MERLTIKKLYNLDETIAKDLFDGLTYPWEALPLIGDFIIKLGNTLDPDIYEKKGDNIWIAKSAKVFDSAYLHGPLIIDEDAEVRQCAFIRGNAIVGKGATVGNSTELKNAILSDKTFVTVLLDGKKVETGVKKFGAMLGDHVEVGCNSVLNPGTVIGKNTNVYPLSFVRGYVAENSIYKRLGEVAEKY